MKLERTVITRDAHDVIVVGGGIAGVAAAVASARSGAKTLLLEKGINLGGLATVGLSCLLLVLHQMISRRVRPSRSITCAFAPYIAVASMFTMLVR